MAGHDTVRKLKKDDNLEIDPDLLAHIRSLGLSAVEDYVAWCVEHGFSRRTQKHWKVRLKERSCAQRAIADARLSRKKEESRKPDRIIERIFNSELDEHEVTQPELKVVCRANNPSLETPETRKIFHKLLQHTSACSNLVSSLAVIRQFGRQDGNTLVDGLLSLARHSANWSRPLTDWKPQTHNSRRQFAALARHLFADWPIPTFMVSVWFLGKTPEAIRQQGWFLHLGKGQNIRIADLPLPYTKRMAHKFMRARAESTVGAALRWGQVRGLGGDDRLARAITGTRLGTSFEHDAFWTTVLQFLIASPMLDLAHVGPIIDYIHRQRFVSEVVTVAPEIVERKDPPQPNFTMKGRSITSLLRQVDAWHGTLAKTEQPKADWLPSGIDGFEFVEGTEKGSNLKIWTITELVSTKALFAEGRHMKHCVASYTRSCASGASSIWTMDVESFDGTSKILTIEVQNSTGLISQARGKCNMLPGEKHRGILKRWAEQAGLRLARHV